ncbi:MAG TPA: nicotinate (nicotinamide) nucleotide adenylyltransferase [Prolixibacteraceae bacterium]|nr:nicotinate (nicotinamide) nucleotide adenylyltransferase [Prolixibacteraceae bacterium]
MNVGLFFGSFNPIHTGHLIIASYIVEYSPIDCLWFVVSPHNPMKKKKSLANDYDRFEMVTLAIGNDPRFEACDIEFHLPKPSYTIHTLTYLKEKYPQNHFSLIMGADNYEHLNKWKNYEVLLSDYSFIVYPRPGHSCDNDALPATVIRVDAPLMEISSTFIRNALAENRDIRHFVPEAVYQYIQKHHLYH